MYTNHEHGTIYSEYAEQYTEQDIQHLAQLLYISLTSETEQADTEMLCEVYRVVVVEDLSDVVRYIDLDKLVSNVHGLTDPIGQLMSWLAEKFSWLVDTLEDIFTNIGNNIISGVESVVRSIVGGISYGIQYLTNFIYSAVDRV